MMKTRPYLAPFIFLILSKMNPFLANAQFNADQSRIQSATAGNM